MKKQQYVAAVACLVAGAIGFASVYATEKSQERKSEIAQDRIVSTEQLSAASNELEPQSSKDAKSEIKKAQIAAKAREQEKKEKEQKEEEIKAESEKKASVSTPVATVQTLHFDAEKGLAWPVEGEILLDYSMDKTIYFPTLEQYRCNPGMVIDGAVNDKVFSAARGKITDITENEVTGCTVKQDLGDGYIAIYGQLKELNFKKGDIVEGGQVIGYVSEPTKYFTTEGSNIYFELQKDGKAINPKDFLPELPMETPEQ